MKPISTDLENIFQPVQLREDEYMDEESKLIYCSRCHTPRQKRFEMTGKGALIQGPLFFSKRTKTKTTKGGKREWRFTIWKQRLSAEVQGDLR